VFEPGVAGGQGKLAGSAADWPHSRLTVDVGAAAVARIWSGENPACKSCSVI